MTAILFQHKISSFLILISGTPTFCSIKKTLVLWILSFACSCLHGAETQEEEYPIKYEFYKKEDCIKVKIVLPEGTCSESTVYKINNPNSKGVIAQIKNDSLVCLENFFQLVDIQIHAIPSENPGEVIFEIIKSLERKPLNAQITSHTIIKTNEIVVKFEADERIDFKDVIPRLTVSKDSPHIKYLRFFTIP